MRSDNVVISLVNEHLGFQLRDPFGEGNGFSGQSPVIMPEGKVMTFYVNGADLLQGHISISASFADPDHSVSIVPLFDHLTVSQFRAGNQLGPTRSAPFSCPPLCQHG